ncbi:MAG: hypothetical protein M1365_15620 [Actinobacteria bacterium]|nr:hypothetical protein [Actinomycetota bacterium]
MQIEERQQYYAQELNKVYKNRIGIFYFDNLRLIFGKISNNFFSALDLNFYFSQSPLIDNGKYPLLFTPLFIIGFLSLLVTLHKVHIIYFFTALSINAFINLDSKLGPLVIFPLMGFCISIGLIRSLKIIKRSILNHKI